MCEETINHADDSIDSCIAYNNITNAANHLHSLVINVTGNDSQERSAWMH